MIRLLAFTTALSPEEFQFKRQMIESLLHTNSSLLMSSETHQTMEKRSTQFSLLRKLTPSLFVVGMWVPAVIYENFFETDPNFETTRSLSLIAVMTSIAGISFFSSRFYLSHPAPEPFRIQSAEDELQRLRARYQSLKDLQSLSETEGQLLDKIWMDLITLRRNILRHYSSLDSTRSHFGLRSTLQAIVSACRIRPLQ